MNKLQVSKRVTQNGKPLALDKFEWCEETDIFKTKEGGLVLDFGGKSDYIFETGDNCTFNIESDCTLKTGDSCTFDTGDNCIFE